MFLFLYSFVYRSLVCLTLVYCIALHVLLANIWAHWSNAAWGAYLGHAKFVLHCGASSWIIVHCQRRILKDATVGFVCI